MLLLPVIAMTLDIASSLMLLTYSTHWQMLGNV